MSFIHGIFSVGQGLAAFGVAFCRFVPLARSSGAEGKLNFSRVLSMES